MSSNEKFEKMKSVFDTGREYGMSQPMFFGQENGLIDTINRPFPHVFDLYKQALAQNWSEDEFDFVPCMKEFQEGGDVADIMIDTIAFQWEADSIAANTLLPVLAPFITNSELHALITFNTYIEIVHSNSYSDIVKFSFTNPNDVLKTILSKQEAFERVSVVGGLLAELKEAGLRYQLGEWDKEKCFPILYKGVVALLLLERLQFIASFAITFALGEAGMFIPIANCVRKICSDEIQIHALTNIFMLEELRKDEEWDKWKDDETFHSEVLEAVNDVIQGEMEWTEHLFKGRTVTGISEKLIKDWVNFNGDIVKEALGFEKTSGIVENPLPWITSWLTLNKLQQANQETDSLAYKMGAIDDDSESMDFDF